MKDERKTKKQLIDELAELRQRLAELEASETERKRVEEALREKEERYRSTLDAMLEGCQIIGYDWRYLYVNDAVAGHGRETKEQLLGRTMMEVYPGFENSRAFTFLRRCMEERIPHRMENEFTYPDGDKGWFELSIQPVPEGIFVLSLDITERKRAEEAIARAKEDWERTFDAIPDLVAILDDQYRIVRANKPMADKLGLTPQEAVGQACYDCVHGTEEPPSFCPHDRLLADGQEHVEEVYEERLGGDFLVTVSPIYDARGELIGSVHVARDITERKRAEEELREYREHLEELVAERTAELNERVAQVEQLNRAMANLLEDLQAAKSNLEATATRLQEVNQELEEFAYVVSHDLKAPLRGITQLANWVSADYANLLDEEGREMLRLLTGRAKRMHSLIEGILQYSRVGRVREKEKAVDLDQLVQETIEGLAPPEHVRVTVADELPTVVGEQTRLTQVFQNLLSNGIRFLDKPDGWVTIGCVDEGTHWRFSVADNGPGIEEKYYSKIFQIFQTLAPRDQVESTGIGLAVVKKIVETWGGNIWVESTVGEGSTFYFTLPKREREDEV